MVRSCAKSQVRLINAPGGGFSIETGWGKQRVQTKDQHNGWKELDYLLIVSC